MRTGIGFDGVNVPCLDMPPTWPANTSRNACWINFAFDRNRMHAVDQQMQRRALDTKMPVWGDVFDQLQVRDAVRAQPGFPGSPAKAPHRKRVPPFPAVRFAHLGIDQYQVILLEPGGQGRQPQPPAIRREEQAFSSPRSSLDSTGIQAGDGIQDTNCPCAAH